MSYSNNYSIEYQNNFSRRKWMEKLWDLINFSIDKYWLWDVSQSLIIFWRFKYHLSEIMWERVLKFVECDVLKNWFLYIKWKSPAWANEIQILKYEILEKLQKDFWREKIKWIYVTNWK